MNKFEWDEAKNRTNIRKHGLDFVDAEEMFRGLLVVRARHTRRIMERSDGLESGSIRGRRMHLWSSRNAALRPIRIISLRKADHEERKQYEEAIQNRLEAG